MVRGIRIPDAADRKCVGAVALPLGRRICLLAFAVGFTACGLRSLPSTPRSDVPTLRITLATTAATVASRAQRARVEAELRIDGSEASAHLDLSDWPNAAGAGAEARIAVKLTKKSRLLGLRRFRLRRPQDEGFQSAPLVFLQLRREGVLTPRIRFVRVSMDGVDLGLMALEEAISKQLLESQQRRESIVFRFRPRELPVARVDVYQPKRVDASATLKTERATASGLLHAYLRSEIPAAEVFDLELLARFLAVAIFWDAESLLRADQLRFYFNPVIQRLEPVASSRGISIVTGPRAAAIEFPDWAAQLFADAAVRVATARALQRIAAEFSVSAPPLWFEAGERRILAVLRGAGIDAAETPFSAWAGRAGLLERLAAAELDPTTASDRFRAPGRRLLPDPAVASLRQNPVPSSSLEDALARHPFLDWSDGEPILRASSGEWDVDGSLVLPDGLGLDIGPGTTLRFGPDAMLLASGPLRFRGSASAPVTLRGQPSGDGSGSWQGLVVLRSSTPVEWEHVIIADTTGIDRRGWHLTGGVTLRAADVRISNSSFGGNRAEDALNLIRSRFEFRGISLLGAASDAFDCDFCDGRVTGGRIADAGGDGIDVSGSVVVVVGTVLEDIRDKAISVGEGSRLEARDLRIRRVGTAIVGKDGSTVQFEDSDVSDVRHVAIMAYTKKREYGPGNVTARNIRMTGVPQAVVAQHGSRLVLDGVITPTDDIDVDDLYEQGYMQK